MLILSRREGESIFIQINGMEPIRVQLNRVTGGNLARIGIDAPDNVQILREELLAEGEMLEPI